MSSQLKQELDADQNSYNSYNNSENLIYRLGRIDIANQPPQEPKDKTDTKQVNDYAYKLLNTYICQHHHMIPFIDRPIPPTNYVCLSLRFLRRELSKESLPARGASCWLA